MIPYAELNKRGQIARLRTMVMRRLPNVKSLRIIHHQHNSSFRAVWESGERAFIRVGRLRDRSVAQLQEEYAFIEMMRRAAIQTPGVLHELLTDDREEVGEPRSIIAFEWVSGQMVSRVSEVRARNMGRLLAHMHNVDTAHLGQTRGEIDGFTLGQYQLEDVACAAAEALGYEVSVAMVKAFEEYQDLREAYGSRTAIHADLHPWNVLFCEDEPWAIDFDDMGRGPLAYDLVVPIRELESLGQATCTEALLAGYAEVRPLPPGTSDGMHALKRLRLVQLMNWAIAERKNPGFEWWEKWCLSCAETLRKG